MTDIHVNDALAMLAALVNRSGGNVKLKKSDFENVHGKNLEIIQDNGFVRVTTTVVEK